MRTKIVKDDVKYILFSEIYHRATEPKVRRKAFSILESAIACYARKGLDAVTLEMIAREAGVTRPLLKHYFQDANDLKESALKYVRVVFQRLAIEALQGGKDPQDSLGRYVDACFFWIDKFSSHALTWQAFLHRCSKDKKSRELNTLAANAGEERIAGLLLMGQKSRVLETKDAALKAKMIQALITGSIVCLASENLEDPTRFKKAIRAECLRIADI